MGGFIKIIEFQELANWKVKWKRLMPSVNHKFYIPWCSLFKIALVELANNDTKTSLYIRMQRKTAHDQFIYQHDYWILLEYKMDLVENYK